MTDKTLPAIKVVDEILKLATTITDEEIEKALSNLSQVEGTYGLLWGFNNRQRSGMDLDYYQLKGKVLRFLEELRKDRNFNLAVIVTSTTKP